LISTALENYFEPIAEKDPTKTIKNHGVIECSILKI